MFVAGYLGSCAANMAGYCACMGLTGVTKAFMKQSSRVAYSFLFFMAIVIAWIMRDFARPLIEKIPCAWGALACNPRAGASSTDAGLQGQHHALC